MTTEIQMELERLNEQVGRHALIATELAARYLASIGKFLSREEVVGVVMLPPERVAKATFHSAHPCDATGVMVGRAYSEVVRGYQSDQARIAEIWVDFSALVGCLETIGSGGGRVRGEDQFVWIGAKCTFPGKSEEIVLSAEKLHRLKNEQQADRRWAEVPMVDPNSIFATVPLRSDPNGSHRVEFDLAGLLQGAVFPYRPLVNGSCAKTEIKARLFGGAWDQYALFRHVAQIG